MHILRFRMGFTLLELMAAVLILGLLLAFAIPGFRQAWARMQVQSACARLTTSLAQARLAALFQRTRTVVCPSADGLRCLPGADWTVGWVAYHDANRNDRRDAGEPVLSRQPAEAGVRIQSTSGRHQVAYQKDGRSSGSNITITVCAWDASVPARQIIVSNSGRNRMLAHAGCPLSDG